MADSWLIRDGMDRERMLDMDARIEPLRRKALLVLAVCLVLSGPWIGWWTLIPLTVAGVFFTFARRQTEGVSKPENVLFAGWAASEVMIAASVALTGGVDSPAMAWFAIPIVTLSARFSVRGVTIGVATTVLMMVGVAFAVDTSAVLSDPPSLFAPIALVISAAILSTALMQSDREHRTEAVIDPLTGLLNRHALANRTEELTQRSAITSEPIGVIVADIDHFKVINDEHGHQVGDAVLKDLAYLLRKELRAFDLAYRIGGEEFLLLLPGADFDETLAFAHRLHRSVAAGRRGGLNVTMSFGVSCSSHGEVFDYDHVFEAADAALYAAKNSGRNRVCHFIPGSVGTSREDDDSRIAV
ncbi:MAG: GGDEF domain-containing protein [Actinobacteria bacterium]|nr:GGDEF domain-containing protein [Actinomycetota bacterium]